MKTADVSPNAFDSPAHADRRLSVRNGAHNAGIEPAAISIHVEGGGGPGRLASRIVVSGNNRSRFAALHRRQAATTLSHV